MEQLTDKQQRYVQYIATGMDSRAAAKAAGYSDSFAKVASYRMKKNQSVVAANEVNEAALRAKTLYTQEKAVDEIDTMIKAALGAKNPAYMAAAQLLLLKCKIHGLVRDKIEVEHVNLRGALDEARTRVFSIVDIRSGHGHDSATNELTAPPPQVGEQATGIEVNGSPKWEPLTD